MGTVAALSNVAARVGLVVLLEGRPLRLQEAGDLAGVRRPMSLSRAARELEQMGWILVERTPGLPVMLLATYLSPTGASLQSSPAARSDRPRDEGGSVTRTDIDTDLDSGLYLYRHPSLTPTSDSREAAAGPDLSNEAVIPPSESVGGDPHRKTMGDPPRKVMGVSKSDGGPLPPPSENDGGTPIEKRGGYRKTMGVAGEPPSENDGGRGDAGGAAGEDAGDAALTEDDLLAAVEAADGLERGTPTIQRDSPFVLRRTAQIVALQAVWQVFLHREPPQRQSLAELIRLAHEEATLVAEVVLETAERVAGGGLTLTSPFGYIRAALVNRMKQQAAQPTGPSPASAHRLQRLSGSSSGSSPDDAPALEEPTEAFLAQLAHAKQMSTQLWGED